jgi:hypothetical protein
MILWLILILIGLAFWLHHEKKKRYPPGPLSVPIFGSFPVLAQGQRASAIFSADFYQYGDMATLYMGPSMVFIIINNFQLAKELFAKDEFSGIPKIKYSYCRSKSKH